MREVVDYSKIIYFDNLYDDQSIPHRKEDVIFRYNSAKFDTNIIFNELHNPPEWSLGSIIRDLNNFKQLCTKVPFDEPEDPREREMDLDEIEELEVVLEIRSLGSGETLKGEDSPNE
jgi:hypothetical protein